MLALIQNGCHISIHYCLHRYFWRHSNEAHAGHVDTSEDISFHPIWTHWIHLLVPDIDKMGRCNTAVGSMQKLTSIHTDIGDVHHGLH